MSRRRYRDPFRFLTNPKAMYAFISIMLSVKLMTRQGGDVIIEKGGIRTAIQAKKYSGSVGNSAIQEVVASKAYYRCQKAMAITTGYFTKAA